MLLTARIPWGPFDPRNCPRCRSNEKSEDRTLVIKMLDRGAQRPLIPTVLVLTRPQNTNAIHVKRYRISCQSRAYAVYLRVLALSRASCYPQSKLPFVSTVEEIGECVQLSVSAIRKYNVHMGFFRISLRETYQIDGNESMRGTGAQKE